MSAKMKVFGFYIILIIVLAYVGSVNYPDNGKEKGVLLGVILSAIMWDQYGREMVANDRSY
jgi:hypothetical protein